MGARGRRRSTRPQRVADGELKFRLNGEKLKGRFTIVRTSRRPGQRADDRFRGRPGRAVAADPQARRRGDARLGRRGPPAERQDRPDQRRGQGQPRRALDQPGARGQRRDRPAGRRARRRCPHDDRADAGDARDQGVRRRRTGCTRSNGTASASRRSSTRARSGLWTRNLNDAATLLPAAADRRRLDRRAAGRSSMARSSRSTTTGRPDFSLLQTKLGEQGREPASSTRSSTCCTSTGGRLLDVPLEDRKRLLKSVLKRPSARALRLPRRAARAWRSSRPPRRRASKGSSPSSAGPATSPADAPRLAQDQDPAGAGARGRRLDAGARAARRTSARSRSASTRTASCTFAGKVGSGFTGAIRKRPARRRWRRSCTDDAAVRPAAAAGLPGSMGRRSRRTSRWVRPELVIRAEIGGWTRDGHRPPDRVQGHRAGRDPTTVTRERAVATTTAVARRRSEPEPPRSGGGTDVAEAIDAQRPSAPKHDRRSASRPRRPSRDEPRADLRGATPSELAALDAAHQGGRVARRRPRAEAHEPRQGAVPAPRRRGRAARHEARPHPLLRAHRARRCCRTSPTGRSTCSGSRTAPARRGSGRRTSRRRRPSGSRSGTRPASTARGPGRERPPGRGPRREPCAGSATRRRFEIHAWTGKLPEPVAADVRPTSTSTPATKTTWDETLDARPALPDGARASRRPRLPQDHRQARHPDLDPDRAGKLRVHARPAPGSSSCRGRSAATVPDLVSWEWAKARRGGKARLDYTQNAASRRSWRRTRSGPRRARRFARRSAGTSSTTRRSDPTAGRSARSPTRVAEVGDLFAEAQTDAQELPPV